MAEDYRKFKLLNNKTGDKPFDFLGETGVCKTVQGEETLPSVTKPPVIRDGELQVFQLLVRLFLQSILMR